MTQLESTDHQFALRSINLNASAHQPFATLNVPIIAEPYMSLFNEKGDQFDPEYTHLPTYISVNLILMIADCPQNTIAQDVPEQWVRSPHSRSEHPR